MEVLGWQLSATCCQMLDLSYRFVEIASFQPQTTKQANKQPQPKTVPFLFQMPPLPPIMLVTASTPLELHNKHAKSYFCDAQLQKPSLCQSSPQSISNLMLELADTHSQSEEEPQCTSLSQHFSQIQGLISFEGCVGLRAEPHLKLAAETAITLKMRGKLIGWLEKLALTAFKFHRTTFITSVLILDQYLEKAEESPSNLQLLGCTALLIASKMCEEVIIAPECYCAASCNIYSKKQLLQKQRIVYSQIDWRKIRNGVLRVVRLVCQSLHIESSYDRVLEILAVVLRQERCCQWQGRKLVYAVLTLATMEVTDSSTLMDRLNSL